MCGINHLQLFGVDKQLEQEHPVPHSSSQAGLTGC